MDRTGLNHVIVHVVTDMFSLFRPGGPSLGRPESSTFN